MALDPITGMPLTEAYYAVQPCGPKDKYAKFPELTHYDCWRCRGLVKTLLISRAPSQPKPKKPEQLRGPWVIPND